MYFKPTHFILEALLLQSICMSYINKANGEWIHVWHLCISWIGLRENTIVFLQREDYWNLERKLVISFAEFGSKRRKEAIFYWNLCIILCIIYSSCRNFLHYLSAFSSLLPISKASLKNKISKRTMYQLFLTGLERALPVLIRKILWCSLTACTKTLSQN